MAETSTKVSGGVQGLDTEIHIITWDATDETLEVATRAHQDSRLRDRRIVRC
jgi:hypothetical protein